MRHWVFPACLGLLLLSAAMPLPADDVPAASVESPLTALQFFQGSWNCSGQLVETGKPIESNETFALILDGQWLRMQHRDRPPNTFAALQLWGFEAANKRYIASIFDNFGGARRYISPGWDGNRWIWANLNAGNHTDRFVFERQDPDSYQMTYQVRRGLTPWQTGDTLSCHRE